MCNSDMSIDDDLDSDVIYYDPTNDMSADKCWKCWSFPKVRLQKDVIIENPKYCWLYPRLERKKLRKVEPNFDEVKTLYTKCDYKLEACVHAKILEIEDLSKAYAERLFHELRLQKKLIEKIWDQSYRYMLLKNSACCIKVYPEVVSKPTENRALCDFFSYLNKLNLSNCRLSKCLCRIRIAFEDLDERIAQLDTTVESPFVDGCGYKPLPLKMVYEIINDVFKYFNLTLCKLKCWAQLIDPSDTPAIDDYRYLLKSLDDFNGFLIFDEERCTCRRSKMRDCIKPKKPC